MSFEHRLTARFYEIDRAGIVFFGRVYEYVHAALEELLAEVFGHAAAIFEEHGFGMPLVHSEADYRHPIRMGDRLVIRPTLSRVTRRSVTFTYAIDGEDGVHRSTVTLVHAFIDMADFSAIAVPAVFLDRIEKAGLLTAAAENS